MSRDKVCHLLSAFSYLLPAACGLLLLASRLSAAVPLFAPAWSYRLDGTPMLVRVCHWNAPLAADVVVVLEPDRVLLLSADGTHARWNYRNPEPITDVCEFPDGSGHSQLAIASAYRVAGFDAQYHRAWEVAFPAAAADPIRSLSTGDVNGDGHPELVAIRDRSVSIISRNGDRNIQTATFPRAASRRDLVTVPWAGPRSAAESSRMCSPLQQVALADVNRDGRDEILIDDGRCLEVYGGAGQTELVIPLGQDVPSTPARHRFDVANLENDSQPQVVVLDRQANVTSLLCLDGVEPITSWKLLLADSTPDSGNSGIPDDAREPRARTIAFEPS